MVRPAGLALIIAALSGCATAPQADLLSLDPKDPAFKSQTCADARADAKMFDNKTGQAVGVGIISGAALGPFGIIPAAAYDFDRNGDRAAFNSQMELRCRTPGYNGWQPGQPAPRGDKRTCSQVDGKIKCEAPLP
jgi:hypothetical protein